MFRPPRRLLGPIRRVALSGAAVLDHIIAPFASPDLKPVAEGRLGASPPLIMHAVMGFSKPSETFIYDMLTSIEESQRYRNVVLTYERLLELDRPFPNVIALRRFGPRDWQQPVIRKVLTNLQPCLVHCHFGSSLRLVGNMRLKWGIQTPAVVSMHGTDVLTNVDDNPDLQRLLRWSSRQERMLFTVPSSFLGRALEARGIPEKQILVQGNSVHPQFGMQRKTSYDIHLANLKIVSNGRLVPLKGHRYLLRAVAIAASEIPEISVTIISDGPELNTLERLASELGIRDRVEFVGSVAHHDVPQILRNHDLYVQPSVRDSRTGQEESFGVAVLEAIAIGLPVIASTSGGIPEVLGKGSPSHRLVPPGDAAALASAILAMVRENCIGQIDETYRTARLAIFSRTSTLDRISDVYQHLIFQTGTAEK